MHTWAALMGKVAFCLSHNGRAVFFQAEQWEERHCAREHVVCQGREP